MKIPHPIAIFVFSFLIVTNAHAWIIKPKNEESCISRYAQQSNDEVAQLSIRMCYILFDSSRSDRVMAEKWVECALEKNKSAKTPIVAKVNLRICQEKR